MAHHDPRGLYLGLNNSKYNLSLFHTKSYERDASNRKPENTVTVKGPESMLQVFTPKQP